MTSPAPAPPADSGSSSVARFLLVPYDPHRGPLEKNTLILDQLCARPQWTQAPLAPADLRANYAALLVDQKNGVFEVWRGDKLVGILTLHGIVPGVEATLHFVFFDGNLIGRRSLIRQFIGKCFRDFGFRRLVMAIPEPVETLVRFARKLGFRYEGEMRLQHHAALPNLGMEHPHVWVAKQGSRREQAHWQDGSWRDLIVLRLLASEYEEPM